MYGKVVVDMLPNAAGATYIVVKHAPKLRYVAIGIVIGYVLAYSIQPRNRDITV